MLGGFWVGVSDSGLWVNCEVGVGFMVVRIAFGMVVLCLWLSAWMWCCGSFPRFRFGVLFT